MGIPERETLSIEFKSDRKGLRRKSWTVPYAASPRLRRYCAGLM